MMRVFVAGGTGAVGRRAVAELVAAGHEVSALARSEAKAALFDTAELGRALIGQEAVINLATAIPPVRKSMNARAWAANQRVRTEGSMVVVDAALFAGVGRVVQMLAQARHHVILTLGDPNGFQSSIHLDDAGIAADAALDVPGGVYNVLTTSP